jgi:GDP-D-mannose dehydratase
MSHLQPQQRDSSKALRAFGWRPKTTFVDLITQMVEQRIKCLKVAPFW